MPGLVVALVDVGLQSVLQLELNMAAALSLMLIAGNKVIKFKVNLAGGLGQHRQSFSFVATKTNTLPLERERLGPVWVGQVIWIKLKD